MPVKDEYRDGSENYIDVVRLGCEQRGFAPNG